MSGANTIPPIPLRFDGAENVQRTIDAIVAKVGQLETANRGAAAQMGTLRTQADAAGGAFRGAGQTIQQAGYQLQDFTVQVQAGTNWLTALSQQGSQFLGIFGAGGAIAGAALAIGAVGAQFLMMGESAEKANKKIEDGFRANQRAGEELTRVVRSLSAELLTAGERAAVLANNQRQALIGEGQQSLMRFENDRLMAGDQYVGAQRTLARLTAARGRLEQDLAAASPRNRAAIESDLRGVLGEEFAAQSALDAARRTMDQASTRITELRTLIDRASAINTGAEEHNYPPAPGTSRPGAGGGSARRDPNQYGPLDGSPESLLRIQRGRIAAQEAEERDRERLAREEQQFLERQEQANRRATDRIVEYGAEAFADLFDKNGKGWDGLMETFEKTAKRTFARIAAEAVIRPVVAPIVDLLGLGSLGSLFGGGYSTGGGAFYSGGMRTYGGGGGGVVPATAAGGGGGGLLGSLGQYGQFASLGRSVWSGNFSTGIGLIDNPIWQAGAGWFAPALAGPAVAAPSIAGMSTSAAMASLPAVPAAATTGIGASSGGMMGSLGAASVGAYAAGVGGGYMIGSMLGDMIAKTDAQRLNSQIGAGAGAVGGAVAGAAVGSVVPVIGTALGAVIGGLLGGAGGGSLGGIIGPSQQFSGGDVGIGIDANGMFTIVGKGGKRWDAGGVETAVQEQLNALNQGMGMAGIRVSGAPAGATGKQIFWDGAVDNWGFGGSSQGGGDARSLWASMRPWMTSDNANVERMLRMGNVSSVEDVINGAQWIREVYEPMLKAGEAIDAFGEALRTVNDNFNPVIDKARELGLAESELAARRDKAIAELYAERDRTYLRGGQELEVRQLLAQGKQSEASLLAFNVQQEDARRALEKALESYGFGSGTSQFSDRMAMFDQTVTMERDALLKAQRGAAGGNDFLLQLTAGGMGGLAPEARYFAGLQAYNAARQAGDLGQMTSVAQTFLPVARDFLGTSERYAALTASIGRDVAALGGDQYGLAALLDVQSGSADSLASIAATNGMTLDEIKAMRNDINRLALTLEGLVARRSA